MFVIYKSKYGTGFRIYGVLGTGLSTGGEDFFCEKRVKGMTAISSKKAKGKNSGRFAYRVSHENASTLKGRHFFRFEYLFFQTV